MQKPAYLESSDKTAKCSFIIINQTKIIALFLSILIDL